MLETAAESVVGVNVDLLGYSDKGLLILAETRALLTLTVGFRAYAPRLSLESVKLHGPGRGADRDGK